MWKEPYCGFYFFENGNIGVVCITPPLPLLPVWEKKMLRLLILSTMCCLVFQILSLLSMQFFFPVGDVLMLLPILVLHHLEDLYPLAMRSNALSRTVALQVVHIGTVIIWFLLHTPHFLVSSPISI